MNNKVENTKQPVLPDENSFNDKDILQDMLSSFKSLTTEYGLLSSEASNETLKTDIDNLSKALMTEQRNIFNLMFEKGWYSLEKIDNTKLTEEINKHQQSLEELEKGATSS